MEEVYSDIKPTSYSLSNSQSIFLSPALPSTAPTRTSSMSPLCFYGGIIILLSHPLLLRLERNNKFQDGADTALLQLKLILFTRQKRRAETQDNEDRSVVSKSSLLFKSNCKRTFWETTATEQQLWERSDFAADSFFLPHACKC